MTSHEHCLALPLDGCGHASGLWAADAAGSSPSERTKLSVVLGEVRYRLGGVRRDCLWSEPGLSGAENKVLEPLWTAIA